MSIQYETHQQRGMVSMIGGRHINQRLQLRGVALQGVKGREQVLGQGKGAELGLDGGRGGQRGEFRAGEQGLLWFSRVCFEICETRRLMA